MAQYGGVGEYKMGWTETQKQKDARIKSGGGRQSESSSVLNPVTTDWGQPPADSMKKPMPGYSGGDPGPGWNYQNVRLYDPTKSRPYGEHNMWVNQATGETLGVNPYAGEYAGNPTQITSYSGTFDKTYEDQMRDLARKSMRENAYSYYPWDPKTKEIGGTGMIIDPVVYSPQELEQQRMQPYKDPITGNLITPNEFDKPQPNWAATLPTIKANTPQDVQNLWNSSYGTGTALGYGKNTISSNPPANPTSTVPPMTTPAAQTPESLKMGQAEWLASGPSVYNAIATPTNTGRVTQPTATPPQKTNWQTPTAAPAAPSSTGWGTSPGAPKTARWEWEKSPWLRSTNTKTGTSAW
jgi:hypothetical protein